MTCGSLAKTEVAEKYNITRSVCVTKTSIISQLFYICPMQTMIDSVSQLYNKWNGSEAASLDVLPQSGSERRYFRLHGSNGSVIGTYGANIKENETFIYFSNHFTKKQLPVANILSVNDEISAYLQEDFGDVSLLNILEAEGFTDRVYSLFKSSLEALAC